MKIVKRIWRSVKREVELYLTFRRLSHSQIETMRRQAALAEAAKRRERNNFEYRLSRRADGLTVLKWRKAVVAND